jgi:hypothetical protein
MVTQHYDIHGLVSIRVCRSARFDLLPEISQPLRYFQVASLDREPDILLEVGDFVPEKQGCYVVDHQFFIRRNYLYCSDAYGSARWQIEITGFEYGRTHIRMSSSYRSLRQIVAPGMLSASLLLRQVVAYHLSKQGSLLAHGAAVSRNGQALILFGRGGAYKTTLLMSLLRRRSNKGWLMLGDDLVILRGEDLLSFPVWAGFFAYRYKYLATENLSRFDRIRLLPFLAKFKPTDLPLTDRSRLTGLIECTIGSNDEVRLEESEVSEGFTRLVRVSAADDHISNNLGPTSAYPRYVEAYSYIFPDNSLIKRWENVDPHSFQCGNVRSWALTLPSSPRPHHFVGATQALEQVLEAIS